MSALVAGVVTLGFASVAAADGSEFHRSYFQYRFVADADVAPIPPDAEFCASAPFVANAYVEGPLTHFAIFGGLLWNFDNREIGFARACLQIADLSFTPFGARVQIYWEFDLDRLGSFTGQGVCLPSSNDMPEQNVVLGGCIVRLTDVPEPFLGGNLVESGNLFNPFGVSGYELSSSIFTLHLVSERD